MESGAGAKLGRAREHVKKRASEKNGHGTERAGERNERRTNNAGRMEKTSDNKSNRSSRSRGGDRLSSHCLNNVDNCFAADWYPKKMTGGNASFPEATGSPYSLHKSVSMKRTSKSKS